MLVLEGVTGGYGSIQVLFGVEFTVGDGEAFVVDWARQLLSRGRQLLVGGVSMLDLTADVERVLGMFENPAGFEPAPF